jgi:hypothetical protein
MSSAPSRSSILTRTRAYWPGRRILPGFGKIALIRMVPVFGSTSRSAARKRPLYGCTLPSARISSPVASRWSRGFGEDRPDAISCLEVVFFAH